MKKALVLLIIVLVVGSVAGGSYLWLQPEPARLSNEPVASPDELPPPIRVAPSKRQIQGFPDSVTVFDTKGRYETTYTGKLLRMRRLVVVPVRLYEIASYTPSPQRGETEALLQQLLVDGAPKVYIIKFLIPLPGRTILKDIYDEIHATFTDVDMVRLGPNIDRFVQQFAKGSKRGDYVYILWLPGGRVYSSFGNPDKVEFIGEDVPLARAIWRIWAGPNSPERNGLVQQYARPALVGERAHDRK